MCSVKFIGIIPARGGSKGIPQKNIKLLAGKPLITYTIEASLESNIDEIIVSTDCEKIAKVAESYQVQVLMRPPRLAIDTTPTLPVLQHVISHLTTPFDAVVTLQPTSPFRKTSHINDALAIFSNSNQADSLVSVVTVPHNFIPEKIMALVDERLVELQSQDEVKRRQDIPVYYARNGAAIYITKTSKLDEFIFGGHILPYFMNKLNSIDIDDIDDWKIAECLIKCVE